MISVDWIIRSESLGLDRILAAFEEKISNDNPTAEGRDLQAVMIVFIALRKAMAHLWQIVHQWKMEFSDAVTLTVSFQNEGPTAFRSAFG